MKWIMRVALLAGGIASQPGLARAQSADSLPARGTAVEVRRVFAAKCAACHGPDLAKPRGRFGYVLDLRRVAGNPEMVVPGHPDESELWVLVQRNEMPPPDAPQGLLTEAEKETIRTWIAGGASHLVTPLSSDAPTSDTNEPGVAVETSPLSPTQRTLRLLGKLHLLVLHFPIALLLMAGVGEFIATCRGSREPSPTVWFCLFAAAVAAVPTVALGWVHAATGNGIGSPQLLTAHRWLGTLAGVWVLVAALCAAQEARHGVRGPGVRIALALGIPLVVVTAHVGGLLVHGEDFLDW